MERTQINTTRNENGKVTMDKTEIQRITLLLEATIDPKNGQYRRNGQTLRKVQFPKTEPGRNRKYEQTNSKF